MCECFNILDEKFNWELRKQDTPFWIHAIAGSSAGVVEHSLIYPLDTIKTRIQSASFTLKQSRIARSLLLPELFGKSPWFHLFRGLPIICFGCIPSHAALFSVYEFSKSKIGTENCVTSSLCGGLSTLSHDMILTPSDVIKQRLQLGSYSSISECCKTVYKREGLKAFYRSLGTILFMNLPFGAIFVTTNETLRRYCWPYFGLENEHNIRPNQKKISFLYFLTAGVAGGVAGALTTPFDVVKTRLQTQGYFCALPLPTGSDKNTTSPVNSSRHRLGLFSKPPFITKKENLFSINKFYRSRNIVHLNPLFFMNTATEPSVVSPLYVTKTRRPMLASDIQNKISTVPIQRCFYFSHKRNQNTVVPRQARYTNFWCTFNLILREEGWRAFWKGMCLRTIFTAPSCAICWGTYETVKGYFLKSLNDENCKTKF